MQRQEVGGDDLLPQVRGKEKEEELVVATWDCGSPLYDSFELASLHHVLESHLMVLPFPVAAVSRSRRFENRGGAAAPDAADRSAARRRRKAVRKRSRGWRGSKAAAAILRAVTCWRKL
ncbi:unnamed protein product [Urochloa decumbens]|uniref:Uncharacterized protein n=1 Tax=Urochloa decumbens TaxID=240449 RepID=A0ABC8ZIM3_9POAL